MPKKPNTRTPNAKKRKDARNMPAKCGAPELLVAADMERQKALKLRREGHTYQSIASALGVSKSTAYEYVNDGWERIKLVNDEECEAMRAEETDRLRAMLRRVIPLATRDNLTVIETELGPEGPVEVRKDAAELQLKAVDRALKISARMCQLYGLDAPVKTETNVTGSALEPLSELAKRVAEAKEKQPAV
jgi:transposase-like protein